MPGERPQRDRVARGERDRGDAAPPGFFHRTAPALWLLFFVICALAAAIFAGLAEAIAVLLVGLLTAGGASLWAASSRRKAARAARRPVAADRDDAVPGMAPDRERPLGDTPEAHDEISAHDLPKEHPGRRAAERQAEELSGTTPGHREGGAAAADAPPGPTSDLVGDDERDGARLQR